MTMMTFYSTTTSSTSNSTPWWLRSPNYQQYYQRFNVYEPSKVRYAFRSAPPNPAPPKEEIQQMTNEEFDAAFNDLLFGAKQEGVNV